MKVSINAAGCEVTIECPDANITPRDLAAEALAVWRATGVSVGGGTEGPAYGFSQDRRWSRPVSPLANGRHGAGMGEVDG